MIEYILRFGRQYLTIRPMKIDPGSPIYSKGVSSKKRKSSAEGVEGFADMLDDAGNVAWADAPESIAPPPSVGSILSIQEVSPDETRKGRTIKRAHAMLDSLEELKLAILLGEVDEDQLAGIREQMKEQKEQIADPQLYALMKEIEIRAAVELAKYGK